MKSDPDSPPENRYLVTPHVGTALASWRTHFRLRQEDLARASGVSLSTVKWIESGRRKRGPRLDTLECLCLAMGITVLELLAGAMRRTLLR